MSTIQTKLDIEFVVDKQTFKIEQGYPCQDKFYKTGEPESKKWWIDNIKPTWTMIDAGPMLVCSL